MIAGGPMDLGIIALTKAAATKSTMKSLGVSDTMARFSNRLNQSVISKTRGELLTDATTGGVVGTMQTPEALMTEDKEGFEISGRTALTAGIMAGAGAGLGQVIRTPFKAAEAIGAGKARTAISGSDYTLMNVSQNDLINLSRKNDNVEFNYASTSDEFNSYTPENEFYMVYDTANDQFKFNLPGIGKAEGRFVDGTPVIDMKASEINPNAMGKKIGNKPLFQATDIQPEAKPSSGAKHSEISLRENLEKTLSDELGVVYDKGVMKEEFVKDMQTQDAVVFGRELMQRMSKDIDDIHGEGTAKKAIKTFEDKYVKSIEG